MPADLKTLEERLQAVCRGVDHPPESREEPRSVATRLRQIKKDYGLGDVDAPPPSIESLQRRALFVINRMQLNMPGSVYRLLGIESRNK